MLNRQKNNTGWIWGRKHLNLIRQSKSNLMGGSASHFDSEIPYYSYGNKYSYGMIDNSFMEKYVNRFYDDTVKHMMSDNNADLIEELVSKELEVGIDGVAKIVPSIGKLIYPILNVANEKRLKI